MFINLKTLIKQLNSIEKQEIKEDYILCFDETGFSVKDNNGETVKDRVIRGTLKELNKETGIEDFLKVSDIAKHLNVSQNTVLSILKNPDEENTLPYFTVGKSIRVKSSDYINFLEKAKSNCQ